MHPAAIHIGGEWSDVTTLRVLKYATLPCSAILALLADEAQTGTQQQTLITSSTRVVVVLIPGFPLESILLGLIAGGVALFLMRRRRQRSAGLRN